MGIQDVVRWFLPREEHFYDFLEKQATVARDAAKALLGFKDGKPPAEVRAAVQELENKGDTIFRGAVSALFKDPTVEPKQLLREKEVLEDLEEAIDLCEHVAETLANLAVKHG